MVKIVLKGVTWGHRRAIDPLLETLPDFRQRRPDVAIEWSSRPLHGFEFTPIEDLAKRHDLIILDHPFVGDIAAMRSLLPLDALLDADLAGAFVGPSLASYRYDGKLWALPVDVACQVGVVRPDLLARFDRAPPRTWDEVLDLGARASKRGLSLAIGLRGVHALMTFFTLCANLGRPCTSEPAGPLVNIETARTALAAIRALLAYCPREVLDWNSINLHEAMVARDDLVCCPAVYCYATYAEADQRRPLRFFDLPGLAAPTPRGSTIGGAGIGVSARAAQVEAAFDYVGFLMRSGTQRAFAVHHGQPARIDSWEDPEIDARFGGCFGATRASLEAAWIRPRYPGYLAFQAEAAALIEHHLRDELPEPTLFERLDGLRRPKGSRLAR